MIRASCLLLSRVDDAVHQRRDSGATMVEYAIMVAFVAAVAAATVGLLGGAVKGLFSELPGTF